MENITNEQINKVFGMIFQQYRLKNNLTQEKLAEELSKSTKTISQLETAKDGTSKMTDINLMNFLGIAPNVLYKDFITNPELKQKIEISEKIDSYDKAIEPYDDCCSIFAPDSPITKPKLKYIEKSEENLDIEELENQAIDTMEIIEIAWHIS